MDGARGANAIATLNVAPKEMTWRIGVDVICFGGAKNGLPLGEAVVFFRKEAAEEFSYRCKQAGQLTSKERFMAAAWLGLLKSNAWLENAQRANRSAERLERELQSVPGIELLHPRQANAVFVRFPPQAAQELRRRGWSFYEFIGGGARLMCSWDTTEGDVKAIVADIRQVLGRTTNG
jgi:threonine aldolase